MLRRIAHNFAARLATALLNFGVVWLTARYLGASGRGAISLFLTDCAALLLFIGLVGGPSLIYLTPRRNIWHLLLPAYGWAGLVCAAGTAVVAVVRQPGSTYLLHLGALSLLQAFFSINTSVLLGRRREATFNWLTVLQVALLAGGLAAVFFWDVAMQTTRTYYAVAYLAFGVPWLLTLPPLARLPDRRRRQGRRLRATTRELVRHSRGAHFSNLLTFANYRLGYYLVAHYANTQALGVLSVGVALMEAIWLIPRSAALVQYVELVHTTATGPLPPATLRISRLTLLATAAAVLVLLLLPPSVLTTVFGAEFGAARPVMLLLAPGTLAIALQMQLSSYFAGVARYRINNLASGVGLVVTLLGCIVLIPSLGIRGVAVAASLSYSASMLYLLWQFRRATGVGVRAFLPHRSDFAYCWHLVRPLVRPAITTAPAPPATPTQSANLPGQRG